MSYILDALKKLEKERRRGNVPDLLTTQEFTEKKRKKRLIWPYLIVTVLLLNAVVLVWWLSPWETKNSDIVSQSKVDKSINSKTVDSPLKQSKNIIIRDTFNSKKTMTKVETDFRKTEKKPANSQHRLQPDKNNLKNKVSKEKPASSDINSSKEKDIASKNLQKRETENIVALYSDDIIEPPLKNRIYNFDELPISIKQKLPPLKITVFLYSDDPVSRMAKINDQLLREGQYLAAGLKLEEISNDGVIFTYQNYRFRIGLK